MEKELEKADREVLVEIVKFSQKHGLKGVTGGWKEFLNLHDRKFGAGMSDPSKRSMDDLLAFLKTFSAEEDLKIFANFLRRHRNLGAVSRHTKGQHDDETRLQRLIRMTVEHPRFLRRFTFPSQNEGWIVIPLGKISKAMKCNAIIAVDCEMVLCEDGTEELVQVCAVDQNLEVKVNMLVKPKKAVIDYRTDITGLMSKDLDGVTYSLIDAQKSLKKLLLHGTILAGHSLHNDLRALKIDHARVIDTSHIFKRADSDRITPSLKDLCKYVLGYDLRKEGEPHDCLSDAEAVMKLILAKLEKGSDNPVLIPDTQTSETHHKKFLLHQIPVDVPYKELQRLFAGKYNFDLQGELKRSGKFYSTCLVFKDPREAREAFEEIECPLEKDTRGRPQKLVSFQLSTGKTTNFYIRFERSNVSLPDHEVTDDYCPEDGEVVNLTMSNGRCMDEIDCVVASMKRSHELEQEDKPRRKKMHEECGNSELQESEKIGKVERALRKRSCKLEHEDEPQRKKMHKESKNSELQETEKIATVEGCSSSIVKKPAPCPCEHIIELNMLREQLTKMNHELSEVNVLREKLKKRDGYKAEMKRLKRELKTRDSEILRLQMVTNDSSRHGAVQ